MDNRHTRELSARPDEVARWIERCWSGTPDDAFPRDVIRSWRRTPPPHDPQALVPGVTRVGHGRFAFRFVEWTGRRWRVEMEGRDIPGWHGFDLEDSAAGCRLTHTLRGEPRGAMRLVWPLLIRPVHDWAVEAIFDRIEVALRTGKMPQRTERPLPWRSVLVLGRRRARAAAATRMTG